jgi:hypothetical protein
MHFKIFILIGVAILSAVGGYFIFSDVYKNKGYTNYTKECEDLAKLYCSNINTTSEPFRSRFGRSSRYGSGSTTETEYSKCIRNYKTTNCEPYYSGLGYAILAHMAIIIISTLVAYFYF